MFGVKKSVYIRWKWGEKPLESESIKINSLLLFSVGSCETPRYFMKIFNSFLHVFPSPPVEWINTHSSAALDYSNVVFSDWDILSFDWVVWHVQLILDFNQLLLIFFNHKTEVLHLSFRYYCCCFGLVISWGRCFLFTLCVLILIYHYLWFGQLLPWWLGWWLRWYAGLKKIVVQI